MTRYVVPLTLLLILFSAGTGLAADPDPAALIAKLAVQKRDAARRTYEVSWANYRDRATSQENVYRWSLRWLEAERQVSDKPADEVAACKGHLERMKDLESLIHRLQQAGLTTIDEVSAAEYCRAEADIWLLQAKAKAEKKP
jgi:hypothetical protein